ncbi:helix-turn-helix domain-containing protein [uncultured Cloacibacillus sp.]|uniref:helix-turn-helix domain-containing protein n=1 Tax=uncultured Cloacibacillus sp. TaxID=889794 RepID=UPI0027D9A852|nr:helix-turn-helix domain-containing protein [uncultured Cloacibacillus sp.]
MSAGQEIKRLRENKGLSVNALAKLANVPQSSLRLYELNQREVPLSSIKSLATELGVHPVELIFEELGISKNNVLDEIEGLSLSEEIKESDQLMEAALHLNTAIKSLGGSLTAKETETLDSMLELCRETLAKEVKKDTESQLAKTA